MTCGDATRTGAARGGDERASARHLRTSRTGAFVALVMALALVTGLLPSRAYAVDDTWSAVLYHSSYDDAAQYIVGASNKYDAAAYICGKSASQVMEFDLTVRAKLSTQGGKFQELANAIYQTWPGWNDNTLSAELEDRFGSALWQIMTTPAGIGAGGGVVANTGYLRPFQVTYWQNNCTQKIWACNVTDDLVSQATADMNTILNGGSLGGGDGESSELTFAGNFEYAYDSTIYYIKKTRADSYNRFTYTSRETYPTSANYLYTKIGRPITVDIELPDDVLEDYPTSEYGYVINIGINSSHVISDIAVGIFRKGTYTLIYGTDGDGTTQYPISVRYTENAKQFTTSSTIEYEFTDASHLFINSYSSYRLTDITQTNIDNAFGKRLFLLPLGEVAGPPAPPPGNDWPDDNDTVVDPTPPPVPTPDDNTTDVPYPPDDNTTIVPTPNPGTPDDGSPTNTDEPTGTTPTDYTPWLRAILAQLVVINNSLSTHCMHLQNQMIAQATRVANTIKAQIVSSTNALFRNLSDKIKWLRVCIGQDFNNLMDYLRRLFQW